MKVFVDTSALIMLLDPRDPRAAAARVWLASADNYELWSHNYVVVETLALVERRIGRAAVVSLRATVFPVMDIQWIERSQHERALDAHLSASRRSSFVDQTSFVAMRDADVQTAFAFDDDFMREGFTLVPG